MDTPTVITPRLTLRPWQDSDREPFAAMNADPMVMEHFERPMNEEESDGLVEVICGHWNHYGFGLWAVEVTGQMPFAGFIGLMVPSWERVGDPGGSAEGVPAPFAESSVEIGWRLAQGSWGKGFATEGAHAALSFAFGSVGLREVQSWTTPDNIKSRRVMEKLRMTHDPADDFDHPLVSEGSSKRHHVRYRISHGQWQKTRAGTH